MRLRIWWQRVSRGWADEDYKSVCAKSAIPRRPGEVVRVSKHELNALLNRDPAGWMCQHDKWRVSDER